MLSKIPECRGYPWILTNIQYPLGLDDMKNIRTCPKQYLIVRDILIQTVIPGIFWVSVGIYIYVLLIARRHVHGLNQGGVWNNHSLGSFDCLSYDTKAGIRDQPKYDFKQPCGFDAWSVSATIRRQIHVFRPKEDIYAVREKVMGGYINLGCWLMVLVTHSKQACH